MPSVVRGMEGERGIEFIRLEELKSPSVVRGMEGEEGIEW